MYGLTESAKGELHVSLAFARKIRDLTRAGRLDWLLHGETGSKAAMSVRLGTPRVGCWTDGLSTAKFATIDVVNESESEATNCWAWAELPETGATVPLHYAGANVGASATDPPRIRISPKKPARLELAFAVPAYGKSPPASLPGVEVTDTVPMHLGLPQAPWWNGEGCWLAHPTALENPDPRLESYLPSGEHKVRVSVGCDNCEGDAQEYVLTSPVSWLGLEIRAR